MSSKADILRTISGGLRLITKAHEIKANPEKKEKCIYFGIKAIILILIAIAGPFTILLAKNTAASAMKACFTGNNWVWGWFVAMLYWIFIVLGPFSAVLLTFDAYFLMILQMTVNRKIVSWIALVVCILGLAAVIYALSTNLQLIVPQTNN